MEKRQMRKYTFFRKIRLKIRNYIERLKEDRSEVDRLGERTTRSMQRNGAWATGAKMHNTPIPYPPFDRSPNMKSRRMLTLKKKVGRANDMGLLQEKMTSIFSVILLFTSIVVFLWLFVKLIAFLLDTTSPSIGLFIS